MKEKRLSVRFKKIKLFGLGIRIDRDIGRCGSCTAIFHDDLILSIDIIKYSLLITWHFIIEE